MPHVGECGSLAVERLSPTVGVRVTVTVGVGAGADGCAGVIIIIGMHVVLQHNVRQPRRTGRRRGGEGGHDVRCGRKAGTGEAELA